MKTLTLSLVAIYFMLACNKADEKFNPVNPNVRQFVELVKNDKYDYEYLPSFAPNDIPELIKNANDFTEITKFPINPWASYYPEHLTIGECLLWTIESIRVYYNIDNTVQNCPSLFPKIRRMNNTESPYLNEESFAEVYNLYKSWWHNNKGKSFEIARKINPLENTNYVWK